MKIFTLIAIVAVFAGCTTISPQERAAARFDPLPANYQTAIKGFMITRLKDPYTAVYRFNPPRKGYWQDGLVYGGGKHFGYIVPVGINARNSFGGYVGEQIYYLCFENGTVGDCTQLWGQMAGFLD